MSKPITELAIIDGNGATIFGRGDRYEIPLYQRPYAWGERNIEELVEDVGDLPDGGDQRYYLGSLVVWRKKDGAFEVIDGQQRLTTLYLLLAALGLGVAKDDVQTLSFSCRQRSDYTLRHLRSLGSNGEIEEGQVEHNIERGYRVVEQLLASMNDEEHTTLAAKLARTCLYRIEVPEHTDLNHYFEIMNTRGEQLEQHEVLKAWLMEPLRGKESRRFAAIWDACADMDGYVQMHFDALWVRETLFDWGYDVFPSAERINWIAWDEDTYADSLSMREIVGWREREEGGRGVRENVPTRFESIIDFRFFLLHVLKVFVAIEDIVSDEADQPLVPSLLDDKKLSATFERVIEHGLWDGVPIDRARFSMAFVEYLLQTRFLFDRCIIKREYVGGDSEGTWSLKELQRTSKWSHHYRNARFKQSQREHMATSDRTNREVLMLESCLRVSYTSPKVMHWITRLLTALMRDRGLATSRAFVGAVETCARDAVREYVATDEWALGVNTPHVVLNYLDYLLWSRDRQNLDDFVFEFRTSVEHWYPQNPSDDTFVRWSEVDRFGNLCLVQRTVNSKFSNLSPLAKSSTFQEMIAHGSLKLREMDRLTRGGGDWRDGVCQMHEEEMISLLRQACGIV